MVGEATQIGNSNEANPVVTQKKEIKTSHDLYERYKDFAQVEKEAIEGKITKAEYLTSKLEFFRDFMKTKSDTVRAIINQNKDLIALLLKKGVDDVNHIVIEDLNKLADSCKNLSIDDKVEVLNTVLAAYHPDTAINHSLKMATELVPIAKDALNLTATEAHQLELGCKIHDVGKLLTSRGKFLDATGDYSILERNSHPKSGRDILELFKLPDQLQDYALMHHEKLSGKGGYPINTSNVPSNVQLLSIIDIYNALSEPRSYKLPLQKNRISNILDKLIKDGEVSEHFCGLIEKLKN